MHKPTIILLTLALALSHLPGSDSVAQTRVARGVFSTAGSVRNGAGPGVSSTLGSLVIGKSQSASHQIQSGFWFGRTQVTAISPDGPLLPVRFELFQNYPNPFNPVTTISYALPQASRVRLNIFDIIGRRVAVLVDEDKAAGEYKLQFDASTLPSSVYFYRIAAGSFVQTKRMLLLK